MKLSLWRTSYQNFLEKYINVSQWGLDKPTNDVVDALTIPYTFSGNSVGFLPTLRDVIYDQAVSSRDVVGYATQDLYILCRLDKDIPYHNLPIDKLEGLHATFAALVLLNWRNIITDSQVVEANRGLLSWEWVKVPNTLTITPSGDYNSDYIAEMLWSGRFSFLVDAESGIIPPPYSVRQVHGQVWRTKLESPFTDNMLDFTSLLKNYEV